MFFVKQTKCFSDLPSIMISYDFFFGKTIVVRLKEKHYDNHLGPL